jgi:hypothetical protein
MKTDVGIGMMLWPPGSTSSGAEEGIRTPDPRITNALLYQLSYFGDGMGKYR